MSNRLRCASICFFEKNIRPLIDVSHTLGKCLYTRIQFNQLSEGERLHACLAGLLYDNLASTKEKSGYLPY